MPRGNRAMRSWRGYGGDNLARIKAELVRRPCGCARPGLESGAEAVRPHRSRQAVASCGDGVSFRSTMGVSLSADPPARKRLPRRLRGLGLGTSHETPPDAVRSIESNARPSRHPPPSPPAADRPAAGDGGRLQARQSASRPTASRRCGKGDGAKVNRPEKL